MSYAKLAALVWISENTDVYYWIALKVMIFFYFLFFISAGFVSLMDLGDFTAPLMGFLDI